MYIIYIYVCVCAHGHEHTHGHLNKHVDMDMNMHVDMDIWYTMCMDTHTMCMYVLTTNQELVDEGTAHNLFDRDARLAQPRRPLPAQVLQAAEVAVAACADRVRL